MLGKIFGMICLISFSVSLANGSSSSLAPAIFDGAGRAVEVTLTLSGMMSLWSGVMEVLREAGAIRVISKALAPLMRIVFPEASRSGRGLDPAVACITANLLGIGNAATPLGIAALGEMQEGHGDTACDDAVMLTVLNTASFSLIPTTVLTLRRSAEAGVMFELLPSVWLVGLIGTAAAVAAVKLFCRVMRQ